MWRIAVFGLFLAGLLGGCVHNEPYDKIVARNGRPTDFVLADKTYTATWGEGPNRHWVVFDKETNRIVDSSEHSKFMCRAFGLCEFTVD
jgi:hypothetical protein